VDSLDDQPLDPETTYFFMSSFALPTTMEALFVTEPHNPEYPGTKLFKKVRDYIIENSPISAETEGRIVPVKGWSEGENAVPDGFILDSVYPNPFNSCALIGFTLPYSTPVSLSVFDVTGRQITHLIDGNRINGFHQIIWNAGDKPAGVYTVVLDWSGGRLEQRAVLVK